MTGATGLRLWLRLARCALLLAALLVAGSASATLGAIEQAYELRLAQVILPSATGGSLIVRPCAACRPVALTVTADSKLLVGAKSAAVNLGEFAKAVDAARRRPKPMIYVYYKPDSRRVNRLVLSQGPAK